MSEVVLTLIGLFAWSILLVFIIIGERTLHVLQGHKKINEFVPDNSNLNAFSQRLARATANSLENLPINAGVLLLCLVTEQTEIIAGTAYLFLAARVLQSLVHIISTTVMAVMLRVTFYSVQLGLLSYWLYQLAMVYT